MTYVSYGGVKSHNNLLSRCIAYSLFDNSLLELSSSMLEPDNKIDVFSSRTVPKASNLNTMYVLRCSRINSSRVQKEVPALVDVYLSSIAEEATAKRVYTGPGPSRSREQRR